MSVIGKGTNSFKKKDVAEQKSIALGFKKIRFAHKSTLGDATINLAALVTPTEMSSNGFTNPTSAEISRSQIQLFRNNLKLVSSLRGLLVDQLSYVVSSGTTITFLDFTAEDGEIFQGWMDEAPTTSLSVVDGKSIVASGILAAGVTDFNIGTPIPLNQNPSQQIGAVMVFADRGLNYRKVGNITSGDGDYIEVPVAGGLGSVIRFNASASDRFITVMSNGVVAERPDGSQTAFLERVQGQIDAMIPTLAAVAGVPTTTFQTAPNNVDLKQFGDTVAANIVNTTLNTTNLTTLQNSINADWSSYTPIFQQDGSAASIVAYGGTIRYKVIGKTVFLQGVLELGYTLAGGGGSYTRFSLPIAGKTGLVQYGLATGSASTGVNGGHTTAISGSIDPSIVNFCNLYKANQQPLVAGDTPGGYGAIVTICGQYEID